LATEKQNNSTIQRFNDSTIQRFNDSTLLFSSVFLGNLENHMHPVLMFQFSTIDGLGIADDADDRAIGAG
jgi:hypothetical protein